MWDRGMYQRYALLIALTATAVILCSLIWKRWVQEVKSWKAGVVIVEITPKEPMWMSGYASRDRPSEGTLSPLWAKALAIEDPEGERALLVTMDLIGINRELSNDIRDAIQEQHGLERADIILSTSHTHSGPVVGGNLEPMYGFSEEEKAKVDAYTVFLESAIPSLADRAFAALQPSRLFYGEGEATFAANRRNNPEAQALELRAAGALKGPIDHSVPVLKVESDSRLRAVVMGYACHATVLDSFQWSGDYPGFAQAALEERYPGTISMFWAGCGADINPMPRRKVELARDYGEQLADAVANVLQGEGMRLLEGQIQSTYEEIPLAFAKVPDQADLEARLEDENPYIVRTAAHLLARPDRMAYVRDGYPYPVQTWSLGNDLTWVALGGEVVVDYALTIKENLGGEDRGTVWVAGYCNDVMAYIPSRRVLEEGGYEGGGAMVYYGLPGPWAEDVEERILTEVIRQARLVE